MKKISLLMLPVIICFLVGFTASQMQNHSLQTWYPKLLKSTLTPPNFVFPIAWSILYFLMGISVGVISISKSPDKRFLVLLFCIQLLLNFLWSILFFMFQKPWLGLIDIILLNIVVIWYAISCWRYHKLSSILVYPYAAWIMFASYLNFYIVSYN